MVRLRCYKVVNLFWTTLWLMKVRPLSTFAQKEVSESFFLVEVGPSNNDCAAFVSRFGNCLCVFLDFLVLTTLPKKVGKFGVTIEFKFVDIVATFFDEEINKLPFIYLY